LILIYLVDRFVDSCQISLFLLLLHPLSVKNLAIRHFLLESFNLQCGTDTISFLEVLK